MSAVTWGQFDGAEAKTCTRADLVNPAYFIEPGDFLFSRANTIDLVGACVIARSTSTPLMLSDKILRLRFVRGLEHWVLMYLRSRGGRAEIERLATGNQDSMRNIGQERIRQICIPIAPIPEQRRIVEALETHLTRLDAAVATLERVRANLGRCRASVLQSAVEGRLMGGASWPTTTLGEVLASPLCHGKSVTTRDGGFPVLRLTAIRRGIIDLSERKGGDWTRDDAHTVLVEPGDFLVARGNGSIRLVGRGGLAPDQRDEVAFPDTMIRVRVREASILPRFLRLVWDAPSVRRQIETMAKTTAGIHKINQKDMRSVVIPIPSATDQAATVVEAERQLSVIDVTDTAVGAQLMRITRLRQSLLRLAFSGRLVPQDPRDEPASVLLDRIRAERAATAATPKHKSARSRR
ncbi:MAG: hypothetical protein IPJ77_19040 [Planctomycetes bacterium]|nr:hypothetical protein [Planctomycetota bacterium]